jgi:hypothetical protein
MAHRYRRIFEEAGPGHHIALFYSDLPAAISAAREYALAGLLGGDFVCLVAPAEAVEEWCELTTEIDEDIRRGNLPDRFGAVFYPLSEIATNGGQVKVNAFLGKLARLAALRSAAHLRVVGRLLGPLWESGWEDAPLDAEAAVSHDAGFSFLCLYDLRRSNGGEKRLQRVIDRHASTITQVGAQLRLDPRTLG